MNLRISAIFSDDIAVIEWADQRELPIFPLHEAKNPICYKSFDYLFSIYNPVLLPAAVTKLASRFAINYHNSYLPNYKGFNAPVWAILNNEKEHGYTWHLISDELDCGDILYQEKIKILNSDTATGLNLKCFQAAMSNFPKFIEQLIRGELIPRKQNFSNLKTYRMTNSIVCGGLISWTWTADQIFRLYRALTFSGYDNTVNLTKFCYRGREYILDEIAVVPSDRLYETGEVVSVNARGLAIAASSGVVVIKKIRNSYGKAVELMEFIEKEGISVGSRVLGRAGRHVLFDYAIQIVKNNDQFWLSRLQNISNPGLIYKSLNAINQNTQDKLYRYSDIDFAEFMSLASGAKNNSEISHDFLIIAVLLSYLYRVNNCENLSVFLKSVDKNIDLNLSCANCSFRLYSTNFSPEDTFASICVKVNAELKCLFQQKPFNKDLLYRYKKLQAVSLFSYVHIGIDIPEALSSREVENGLYFNIVNSRKILRIVGIDSAPDVFSGGLHSLASSHLKTLVNSICKNPNLNINDHAIVQSDEEMAILNNANTHILDHSVHSSIGRLFSKISNQLGDKIAIKNPEDGIEYSYKQLNIISNKIAFLLDEYLGDRCKNIGIYLQSQLNSIIMMISVIKSGNCYIPMLADMPEDFFKNILSETNPVLIVVDNTVMQNQLDFMKANGIAYMSIDDLLNKAFRVEETEYVPHDALDSNAYIMYTSGSTGKSKGVMIKEKGILRLIKNPNYIAIDSDATIAQTSSLAFDASTFTIWGALLNGATLVVVDKPVLLDPEKFEKLIVDESVDILWMPASLLDIYVGNNIEIFSHLKFILTGGEIASIKTINRLNSYLKDNRCQIIHVYGPTENTTFTTYYKVDKSRHYSKNVPIGKPITNTGVFILDRFMNIVPLGFTGEICIYGDGLASGYINNELATREKFLPATTKLQKQMQNENRLYKTGDLARWLPGGDIEYIGRQDLQVKVRGFRIEIPHLVHVIETCDKVRKCAILIEEDKIIAFISVLPEINIRIECDAIKSYIKSHLADYMCPSKVIFLKQLPINKNGKIDVNRLKAIYKFKYKPTHSDDAKITGSIGKVADIWMNMLNLNEVDSADSFFDLGGHSLLFLKMLNEVNRIFRVKIPVSRALKNPTIDYLTNMVNNGVACVKEKSCYEAIKKDLNLYGKLVSDLEYGSTRQGNAILLTGVTGFLGGYLLKELLRNTCCHIYCLVRNFDKLSPHNQVGFNRRVTFLKGDVAKPNFMLEPGCYQEISEKIGIVIHSAAAVNHVYPYEALRDVNVVGAYEIIKFAAHGSKKSINFLSTISAISVTNRTSEKREVFPESLDEIYNIPDGYSQTKWVSEYLLKMASDKGLDVKIFRPGWIFGDTDDGYVPESNHLLCIIKSCIQLGVAPNWDSNLYFLPVDFVALILREIIFSRTKRKIFNINHINGIHWNSIIDSLNDCGYRVNLLPVNEWIEKYIVHITPSNALFPFKELYTNTKHNRVQGPDMTINTQMNNTLEVLHSLGIVTPVINKKLLNKYCKHISGFIQRQAV